MRLLIFFGIIQAENIAKFCFLSSRVYIFRQSNGTIPMALKRVGYKGETTGHSFRGLASTILREPGYPNLHIDVQLAPLKKNQVSGAYPPCPVLRAPHHDDSGLGGFSRGDSAHWNGVFAAPKMTDSEATGGILLISTMPFDCTFGSATKSNFDAWIHSSQREGGA